jgi:hypothetical protein
MIIATIKENPVPDIPDGEEDGPPSYVFFEPNKPFQVYGRLHGRGGYYNDWEEHVVLPDLYLAKKHVTPQEGDSWAALQMTARDVEKDRVKYESYDGNPLSYHAGKDERHYMWLQPGEIDIVVTQTHLAQGALERWDD